MSEPPGPTDAPPPDPTQQNNTDNFPSGSARPIALPPQFQDYPTTFLSSLGRADLAGASPDEQASLREDMYNGWMRPNEYDDRGNMTYGPMERREARLRYQDMAGDITDRGLGNAEFDWDAWQEEYEEGSLSR